MCFHHTHTHTRKHLDCCSYALQLYIHEENAIQEIMMGLLSRINQMKIFESGQPLLPMVTQREMCLWKKESQRRNVDVFKDGDRSSLVRERG